MNINNKIKYYREKMRMSKSELARKTGVSPSYITMLENGSKTNPSLEISNKMAAALDVSVNDLIGDNPQIEEQEPTSEYKTIYVDDLIEQLEKFRGGKVAFVYIGEGNIQIDIDKFKDIRIEEAWGKCPEEDKKDITINIK